MIMPADDLNAVLRLPPREENFTGKARRDRRRRKLESRQRGGESGEHPTAGIRPSRVLTTTALTRTSRDRPSMPCLSKGKSRARFTVFIAHDEQAQTAIFQVCEKNWR